MQTAVTLTMTTMIFFKVQVRLDLRARIKVSFIYQLKSLHLETKRLYFKI